MKEYAPDSYYHLYSRGHNKGQVFTEERDYGVFISLFKRYLSLGAVKNTSRHTYPSYANRVELLSYALMPNHIHLLLYQKDERAIADFMRSLMTSYSMYFNKTHKRVGPVFQSRYKASRISSDEYLDHISRYIHLNPRDWEAYMYSSIRYYRGDASADWIKPTRILELFPNIEQYLEFVRDYEGYKAMLDEIHWDLADN